MQVEPKTATELFQEIGADATLDEAMRRDPSSLTEEDLDALIDALRSKRAQFINKQAKKKSGEEE